MNQCDNQYHHHHKYRLVKNLLQVVPVHRDVADQVVPNNECTIGSSDMLKALIAAKLDEARCRNPPPVNYKSLGRGQRLLH